MVNLKNLTEHRLSSDEARELRSRSFNPDDVANVLQEVESGECLTVPVADHSVYLGRLRDSGVDVRKNGKGEFGYAVHRNGGGQRLVLYRR